MRFAKYMESANDSVAVIVQAEHVRAVENIESIVRVNGIDGIMLGPYDLSASLGKMGRLGDKAVVDAIDQVTQACRSAGMSLGIFGISAESVSRYMHDGYKFIVAGVDTMLMGNAAKDLLAELKANLSDNT